MVVIPTSATPRPRYLCRPAPGARSAITEPAPTLRELQSWADRAYRPDGVPPVRCSSSLAGVRLETDGSAVPATGAGAGQPLAWLACGAAACNIVSAAVARGWRCRAGSRPQGADRLPGGDGRASALIAIDTDPGRPDPVAARLARSIDAARCDAVLFDRHPPSPGASEAIRLAGRIGRSGLDPLPDRARAAALLGGRGADPRIGAALSAPALWLLATGDDAPGGWFDAGYALQAAVLAARGAGLYCALAPLGGELAARRAALASLTGRGGIALLLAGFGLAGAPRTA
jgi:hypothetical protein